MHLLFGGMGPAGCDACAPCSVGPVPAATAPRSPPPAPGRHRRWQAPARRGHGRPGRPGKRARRLALSPPMFLRPSSTFCPSRRTPRATSTGSPVARLSRPTRTTVPSRTRRTMSSFDRSRFCHASQSVCTLCQARLTTSTCRSHRRTARPAPGVPAAYWFRQDMWRRSAPRRARSSAL